MYRKNGKRVLSLNDLNTITNYFMLDANHIRIETAPSMIFVETRFIDTFNGSVLLSFFDHDGKVRVAKGGGLFYEMPIEKILVKNPDMPDQEMLDAVANKMSKKKTLINKASDNLKENSKK